MHLLLIDIRIYIAIIVLHIFIWASSLTESATQRIWQMDSLLSDPFYLLCLFKRIVSCIIYRDRKGEASISLPVSSSSLLALSSPPPPLQLSSFFLSIEKRYWDVNRMFSLDELMEIIRPIFAGNQSMETGERSATSQPYHLGGCERSSHSNSVRKGEEKNFSSRSFAPSGPLQSKDLQLLQYLLPFEELMKEEEIEQNGSFSKMGNRGQLLSSCNTEGKEVGGLLSIGEVLFYLVQLLPQHTFLVRQSIQQVRQTVWHMTQTLSLCSKSVFHSLLVENTSSSILLVNGKKFLQFLLNECGLSVCRALTLEHYCKLEESGIENEKIKKSFSSSTSTPHYSISSSSCTSNDEMTILDGDLVYYLCFAVERDQLDDSVAYPLLAREFAEAVVDPYASSSYGNASGSLFLASVIHHLTTTEEAAQFHHVHNKPGANKNGSIATADWKTRDLDVKQSIPDFFSSSLSVSSLKDRFLEEHQFRQLCWLLGSPEQIISPLFQYLCEDVSGEGKCSSTAAASKEKANNEVHHELRNQARSTHSCHRRVPVSRLISMFYQFFPCPRPSMWMLCRSAFAQCLRKTENPLVFVDLFASFRPWGVEPIPIAAYLQVMRQALCSPRVGTANSSNRARFASGFTDIELEYFRCEGSGECRGGGKDRVSLLRVWTTPLPASRQAVIEKVWAHLELQYRKKGGMANPSAEMSHQKNGYHDRESLLCVKEGAYRSPTSPRYSSVNSIIERGLQHEKEPSEKNSLPVSFILASFCTDRIEGTRPQHNAVKVKEALEGYFKELIMESEQEERPDVGNSNVNSSMPQHGNSIVDASISSFIPSDTIATQHSYSNDGNHDFPSVSFSEVHFFLSLLSAGVEDDPTFTMMLWRGFGVGNTVSRRGRNSSF